ncbi:MAG: SGNH/GDSL hydrolase family protein [Candidatus Sumerlaeaceae bacterium]|nr:SGNH/GDSL hydrolase family protein [Candidatus Sumerlaeaceae bacterium]
MAISIQKSHSILIIPLFVLSFVAHSHPIPSDKAERYSTSSLVWYDARYLTVEGRAFSDTENFWERLPLRAKQMVPAAVWGLSKHTAGLCVRFVTDATTIAASWDGAVKLRMNHMALTGSAGLDLYYREGALWKYGATGRPREEHTTQVLVGSWPGRELPPATREYLLYLPLYHPISELKIGIPEGAKISCAPPRPRDKRLPIVFYGTSITQGGCASRAGMCHVALLGRWLDRPVVNLGFSGSGKSEPEMAQLVSEINAACYVLEPLPNMTVEQVRERLPKWIEILRAARPRAPIVLVMNPLKSERDPQNVALLEVFQRARKAGYRRIFLIPASKQLAGKENGTVDGIHPTDLGFYRMAECYYPLLRRLVADKAI